MANENTIWSYLKSKGMTDYAVAGIMGNLQAESGLNPQNLQNSYEKSLGFTDATYTTSVDNGSYGNFVKDKAGYGLAQWTYWTRKQALLDFAKSAGKSIGDLNMQLDYLWKELSGYKLIDSLNAAKNVLEASNIILLQFEKPANQGESVQNQRARYGQGWYDKFAGTATTTTVPTTTPTSKYSDSPLVTYTNITKNKTMNRNMEIDTITIHCIVGQWTAKQGCDYFATTPRQASANYVVGKDGSIGLSVNEKDRAWTTSSSANDQRAITIEVASDTTHPYAVTDAAMAALIKLCADICKRNGIKKLLWKADKSLIGQVDKQNMTVHRWFAAKACPGEYLYNKHGYIADEVNKLLGVTTTITVETPTVQQQPTTTVTPSTSLKVGDLIKLVSGATYWNGKAIPQWVFNSPLYYRGTNEQGIVFSTLKTGAITGVVKPEAIVGNAASTESTTSTYTVKVTADALNYRSGPGTKYPVNGTIRDHGTYTIVQTVDNWGKLKSGAGWICLDYTKRT